MKKLAARMILIAATLFVANASSAWTNQIAHVTAIETTLAGAPSGSVSLIFSIDQSVGGCTAGNLEMVYGGLAQGTSTEPQATQRVMENIRANLTTLQLALTLNLNVSLDGVNKTSGICVVSNIRLLNY